MKWKKNLEIILFSKWGLLQLHLSMEQENSKNNFNIWTYKRITSIFEPTVVPNSQTLSCRTIRKNYIV